MNSRLTPGKIFAGAAACLSMNIRPTGIVEFEMLQLFIG